MHVVMLTNAISPDKFGGLERYVRELSAGLVRAGCDVTVLAKQVAGHHPREEINGEGVRIVRHRAPSKHDPAFAIRYPWMVTRAVRRALRGVGAGEQTVLHGHFVVPTLVPAMRRLPFLYTFHAPVHSELLAERQGSYLLPRPAQRTAVRGLRAAEALVARRAVRLVTLSDFMRRQVAELDSDAVQRTCLIPGGVDTSRFCPGGTDADPWSGGASPLLFVARRLVPRTGVHHLVRAMPAILAQLPRARLVVAGDGLGRQSVQDLVDGLGLHRAVRLVGQVSDSDLVAWYRRAHLAVTPTQELEGFGLATAEALACGTPAMVTPVGANPEVVEPVSARLVSRGTDPASLAERVVSLCADLATLARLRAAARSRAHPALSWDRVVDRHLELYDEVSAAQRARVGSRP